ncbi:LapA family protein [Microbulbifer agarilyticus]|uniref:LapA family protein n=1 Tax=Microbulbifer agarilyticus TaxID=260552 RepID=UPI001CD4C933|nr:LapA family protein [Microbulbifer agarilyticus]MCA0900764.1 LapA family protein [Microbulbifer agarilyticus]
MSFLRWISRLLFGILALVCIALGVYFAVDNPESITPRLAGYPLFAGSVGFWLIGFLLIGALLGFLASLLPYWTERHRVKALERQLLRTERELHTVRRQVAGD